MSELKEYKYQKKDFVKILDIKKGSFYKIIKDLEIDTDEYRTIKILENGIQAKFFTEEAFNIVNEYLKNKGYKTATNELSIINKSNLLQEENRKLQNAITTINAQKILQENEYLKEITKIKEELEQTKIENIKANAELDRLKNRNLIQRLLNK